MNLGELRAAILNSYADNWLLVESGGAPTFLESIGWSEDASGRLVSIDVRQHHGLAVLRSDVNVRLAWGLDRDSRGQSLSFPWQQVFPDEKVTAHWLDVFYAGGLVGRELIVSVDGGRAYLPLGEAVYEGEHPNMEWVTENVTSYQYKLAELVNGLEGEHQADRFAEYFSRAGFTIV